MTPGYSAYDVVVVGTGPGGSTVARELARAGKRVLMLERGIDHRGRWYYGTHLGALRYVDRHGLLFTREGLNIIRGIMTGGSTNLYCGCAARPPDWFKGELGIDLEEPTEETIDELGLAPLPASHAGEASLRILEAGQALGMDWEPQMKFINPARTLKFHCTATCMTGCRCGAKWTANEFMDQAIAAGADLFTDAVVDRVLVEDGVATGVSGRRAGRIPFEVRAEFVVLAAGGIGTPMILQQSGLPEVGNGMAMDPTVMVYGRIPGKGNWNEPPMSVSYEDLEHGYMLSSLIDPWLMYPLIMSLKGPRHAMSFARYTRTLGIMIKVTDELGGSVSVQHGISKPLSPRDLRRLNQAEKVCRDILIRAGADPDSILVTPIRGTHPSATVRIGEDLSPDLETRVSHLYACDASVFPRALGRPTVLTIIALARRLASHLETRMAPA